MKIIRVRVGALAVVGLLGLACGRAPTVGEIPTAATASASRTASPSATATLPVTSLPDPVRFSSQNCSGTTPTTAARALGAYYTMRVASTWTDTGEYFRESLLLELTAPASYGYAPTRIRFWAFPGEVHVIYGAYATAHSIAVQHAATPEFSSAQSRATSVSDCLIGAEGAGVFGYAQGGERGYRLSMVHKDRLAEIWLFGTGGVSDSALRDALGMIGSIVWTF